MPSPNHFRAYLRDLRGNLDCGNATEHTYRPAPKALLEAAVPGVTATNEPRRIAYPHKRRAGTKTSRKFTRGG